MAAEKLVGVAPAKNRQQAPSPAVDKMKKLVQWRYIGPSAPQQQQKVQQQEVGGSSSSSLHAQEKEKLKKHRKQAGGAQENGEDKEDEEGEDGEKEPRLRDCGFARLRITVSNGVRSVSWHHKGDYLASGKVRARVDLSWTFVQ